LFLIPFLVVINTGKTFLIDSKYKIANVGPLLRRRLSDKGQLGKNIESLSVVWNGNKM
jgi:hypothetical protein